MRTDRVDYGLHLIVFSERNITLLIVSCCSAENWLDLDEPRWPGQSVSNTTLTKMSLCIWCETSAFGNASTAPSDSVNNREKFQVLFLSNPSTLSSTTLHDDFHTGGH